MYTILRIHKFNIYIYINIYVNIEITNIYLFLKYDVLHEDINIYLIAKMVQYSNTVRTHLVLNHKAKCVRQKTFCFPPGPLKS